MATARRFEITAEDLESSKRGAGSSAYNMLEVPADYEAQLVSVEDYDKRSEGKSHGWVWEFSIEDLPFRVYTSFSLSARWKLIEVISAFVPGTLGTGVNDVDPSEFVGMSVGAHVDFDVPEPKWDGNSPRYREIKYVFPLADFEVPGYVAASAKPAEPEVL